MLAGAGAMGARGGDKTVSLTTDTQISAAIAVFQDQKAAFLTQQKNNAKKVRDEVRVQVATAKSTTITPLRQEMRNSIEEAKRQAIEQSRKVAAESAELARDARR